MKEDRQFVTALARGLDVLRCFTPARQVLGSTEIAQLTGLPQPTVWRLCHTLATAGYLVPTSDGEKLRIGAPVLSLGYAALASLDYLQVVRPHMQALADRFSAAVALAEQHRSSMVYLERCQGESWLQLNLQIGSRIPIHTSATGWAWLAALTPDRRVAQLEKMAKSLGAQWPTYRAHIDRAMSGYARDGFIINIGVQNPGAIAAAVPVVSADGRTILSLNCGGASSVISETVMREDVGPALVDLANLIRDQLSVPTNPKTRTASRKGKS